MGTSGSLEGKDTDRDEAKLMSDSIQYFALSFYSPNRHFACSLFAPVLSSPTHLVSLLHHHAGPSTA